MTRFDSLRIQWSKIINQGSTVKLYLVRDAACRSPIGMVEPDPGVSLKLKPGSLGQPDSDRREHIREPEPEPDHSSIDMRFVWRVAGAGSWISPCTDRRGRQTNVRRGSLYSPASQLSST